LRFLIDWVTSLVAPFSHFIVLRQEPIHGSQRTQVDAFIEQGGIDFGWGLVYKPLTMQDF
jgi:hypothetical protein